MFCLQSPVASIPVYENYISYILSCTIILIIKPKIPLWIHSVCNHDKTRFFYYLWSTKTLFSKSLAQVLVTSSESLWKLLEAARQVFSSFKVV
jgi:hypothetical protein